jgi:hypothetical protein
MFDQISRFATTGVCALAGLIMGAAVDAVRQSKRFSPAVKALVPVGIILLVIGVFYEQLISIASRIVIFVRNGISL